MSNYFQSKQADGIVKYLMKPGEILFKSAVMSLIQTFSS